MLASKICRQATKTNFIDIWRHCCIGTYDRIWVFRKSQIQYTLISKYIFDIYTRNRYNIEKKRTRELVLEFGIHARTHMHTHSFIFTVTYHQLFIQNVCVIRTHMRVFSESTTNYQIFCSGGFFFTRFLISIVFLHRWCWLNLCTL